uniref:Translocase of outer mitochondrial membrane 34 n=1 Tax=Fundulus heteroclitus TaxID=8078 RepID=A0A3Q2U8T9_FUNHE
SKMGESEKQKEEGNSLFKAGDMQGAACCYTQALKLSDSPADSAVLHRNRSACYLKLEEYSKAEADASKGPTASTLFIGSPAHIKVSLLLL